MKKVTFLIIIPFVLMVVISKVNGQTIKVNDKHVTVVYNANDPEMPDSIKEYGRTSVHLVQNVWFGKRINFYLDVNPYLYDVYIGSKQVMDDEVMDSSEMSGFNNAFNSAQQGISAGSAASAQASNPQNQTKKTVVNDSTTLSELGDASIKAASEDSHLGNDDKKKLKQYYDEYKKAASSNLLKPNVLNRNITDLNFEKK